jgi:uncharacterized membrane protein
VTGETRRLTPLQLAVGLAFMSVGTLHFAAERFFTAIVPKSLPNPRALVYVSGVAEIAGGAGVLLPRTRRLAGKGLIALLVAVFPANVNMAVNAERFGRFPAWSLWARLPLQALIIDAVRRAALRR